MPGALVLSVIEAKDLAAKDSNGFSDPYAECTIGNVRKKSKIIYKTLTPKWNEDLVYEVKEVPKKILVTLWDDDEGEDPDFLGQVNLELSPNDMVKGEVVDQWFTLEKRSRRSHISGSVHLRVAYQNDINLKASTLDSGHGNLAVSTKSASPKTQPASPSPSTSRASLKLSGNISDALSGALKMSLADGNISKTEKYRRKATTNKENPSSAGAGDFVVNVFGARNLAGKDDDGFSDPFVKLTLGSQKRETFVLPKTLNPDWNEEFIFKGGDIANSVLEMTVWDDDRGGSTDFLGIVKVDLSAVKAGEMIEKTVPLERRSLRSKVSGEIMFRVERIPYTSSPRNKKLTRSGHLVDEAGLAAQILVEQQEQQQQQQQALKASQAPNGTAKPGPATSASLATLPVVTPAPAAVSPVVAKGGVSAAAEFSRAREVKDAKTNMYYKVIMVGDSGVGKTNIFSRYDRNHFSPTAVATVGVDFFSKVYRMDDESLLKVQLWDTAGQERYQTVTKQYYRNSLGAVIVYDISKKKSFQNVDQWAKELELHSMNDNLSILLLGNKCDLPTVAVTTEEGRAKAAEKGMMFFETSALTGASIDLAFQTLLADIHKKELQKPPEERGSKTNTKSARKKTDAPGASAGQPGAASKGQPTQTPKGPAQQHTVQVVTPAPQESGCAC